MWVSRGVRRWAIGSGSEGRWWGVSSGWVRGGIGSRRGWRRVAVGWVVG